ncbi:MAG: hypothetical protein R3F14_17655 [Polyangiaceae bacterium]
METEPAEAREGDFEGARHVGRGRQDGEAALFERFEEGAAVGEEVADAGAEIDDVLGLATGDLLLPAGLSLGGLGLLSSLAGLALAALGFEGFVDVAGGGELRHLRRFAVHEPLIADLVNGGDLLLGEEAAEDDAAIDEGRALVALGRDGVGAADPGSLVRVDLEGALAQLGGGEAEDLGGERIADRGLLCGGGGTGTLGAGRTGTAGAGGTGTLRAVGTGTLGAGGAGTLGRAALIGGLAGASLAGDGGRGGALGVFVAAFFLGGADAEHAFQLAPEAHVSGPPRQAAGLSLRAVWRG